MGFFVVDSFDDHDYLSYMRYKIYSTECSYDIYSPYAEDDDRETAEIVAKTMGIAMNSRWFVHDARRGENVFVYRGDLQFANRKLKTGEYNDQN